MLNESYPCFLIGYFSILWNIFFIPRVKIHNVQDWMSYEKMYMHFDFLF